MENVCNEQISSIKNKKKNKTNLKIHFKRNWPLYVMILPMIIYLLIFSYYPMLGLQLAFKDWKPKLGIWGSPWATNENGELDIFSHFSTLFTDDNFFKTFTNTLRISILRIVIGFPIPIILTILLNEMPAKKFAKGYQIVSYLPHFISWIIISGILTSLTASQSTFQNAMEFMFGRELPFFTDDKLFVTLLIVSDIWKEAGWATIIYFAAISGINSELYEAAAVDGANRLQKILYITLPGIAPAISINLILQSGNLVHGGFDQIFNMYNPLVYDMGDILETYLYRIGITDGDYALGTALGLFNSVIAFLLVITSNKIVKKIGGEPIW